MLNISVGSSIDNHRCPAARGDRKANHSLGFRTLAVTPICHRHYTEHAN